MHLIGHQVWLKHPKRKNMNADYSTLGMAVLFGTPGAIQLPYLLYNSGKPGEHASAPSMRMRGRFRPHLQGTLGKGFQAAISDPEAKSPHHQS